MKSSEHSNIYTDESFNKKRARQTPVTIRKVKAWKTALKCALKVSTYEGGPAAFQGARALLPPWPPQQEAQQVQHEHGRLGEGAEEGLVIVLSLENVLQKELFHKLQSLISKVKTHNLKIFNCSFSSWDVKEEHHSQVKLLQHHLVYLRLVLKRACSAFFCFLGHIKHGHRFIKPFQCLAPTSQAWRSDLPRSARRRQPR